CIPSDTNRSTKAASGIEVLAAGAVGALAAVAAAAAAAARGLLLMANSASHSGRTRVVRCCRSSVATGGMPAAGGEPGALAVGVAAALALGDDNEADALRVRPGGAGSGAANGLSNACARAQQYEP